MSSPHNPPSNYWGFLIRADKSATPLFEQLCLGIAKLISGLQQSNTEDLTPENLAGFYRAVGGNYDNVFLNMPHSSLSFIYQSLGCFHTLQPTSDPFKPPSIPVLRPHGFVRWQTIQLLLCPEEHVVFLQNAVKKFDIINPSTGSIFPKVIPNDSFPAEPDPEMVKWHDTFSSKLENDYKKKQKSSSQRSGLSDRDSQHSKAGSGSIDGSVADETRDYFARRGGSGQRPVDFTRTSSHESPPFNARSKRPVPEFTSPLSTNPELRHDDIDEDPIPRYGRPKSHSRPVSRHRHRSRGRSSTPPRRVRAPSETSLSDELDEGPVRRSRLRKTPDDDVDYERLFPTRRSTHARRHSHDAAYSKKRWNQSPARRRPQREEIYTPEPDYARDHYTYTAPFPIPKAAEFRSYPEDTRRMSIHSLSPRRTKHPMHPPPPPQHPSGIKFRERIFEDDGYSNSAPPSPVSYQNPHIYRPSPRTPTNSYRQYVPRLDPDPPVLTRSHSSRRKASASGGSGGSRSGSSTERARAMSMGGKSPVHLRIDQTMQPMMARRYITPPSSLNGGVAPFDYDFSGEGRMRHGRRGY
ncbi:hypothetical protein AJ79_04264 [Helicocarpus griseus UAMH5409]|uniref:DUF7514 domain-containing protein n=1 Tax=Helicocarpus griseus UAMH5409 TaxID=1447875 RepID=A0A2B7XV23_9EURO|nr:hypothetical protein AJ79_04264 [Helicocarpus griseus UAMH5409]